MIAKAGFVTAVALTLAPAAVAQSGADAFLGKWSCVTVGGDTTTVQSVDYLADGRFKVVDGRSGTNAGLGRLLQVSLTSEGTWTVTPEGKLIEQYTRITATSAKMAGGFGGPQPLDVRPIQQAMDASLAGQPTISTVVFSESTFTSTDADGAVSTCKRQQ